MTQICRQTATIRLSQLLHDDYILRLFYVSRETKELKFSRFSGLNAQLNIQSQACYFKRVRQRRRW